MNRRAFLGSVAAAAIAGPKLAVAAPVVPVVPVMTGWPGRSVVSELRDAQQVYNYQMSRMLASL